MNPKMRNLLTISDSAFLAALIHCYIYEAETRANSLALKYWQDGIQGFAEQMGEKC